MSETPPPDSPGWPDLVLTFADSEGGARAAVLVMRGIVEEHGAGDGVVETTRLPDGRVAFVSECADGYRVAEVIERG